jgi:hypothetical protein
MEKLRKEAKGTAAQINKKKIRGGRDEIWILGIRGKATVGNPL